MTVLDGGDVPVGDCVDVGCGSGQLTQLLVPHVRKITGHKILKLLQFVSMGHMFGICIC